MIQIDTSNTGSVFNIVATVDTVDGEGNPVPAGTVLYPIVGIPDGHGGVVDWAPPEGCHLEPVLTQS